MSLLIVVIGLYMLAGHSVYMFGSGAGFARGTTPTLWERIYIYLVALIVWPIFLYFTIRSMK